VAPGARQHYLPASFVARFSVDPNPEVRQRRLFVMQRNRTEPFELAAENAGFARNLYGDSLDEIWSAYESRLPAALDALCKPDRELEADAWLRVLVPFAAALLLRGQDFEKRFTNRVIQDFGEALGLRASRTARDARILELQRLLAPVTAARWVVMHASGDSHVITSDVGWAPYRDAARGELGFAIPLGLKTILGLVPARTRAALRWNGSAWSTLIDHRKLHRGNHVPLNRAIADFARLQVFGPTRESVEVVRDVLASELGGPADPFPFGPLGGVSGPPNEFTWHRLAGALKKTPADSSLREFALDLGALKDGWVPPIVLPLNLPEFPPALRLKKDVIEIALHAVLSADPSGWVLAQDMPLSYPSAPPESAYAAYQSRLKSHAFKGPGPRVGGYDGTVEIAPKENWEIGC
jgi:hypothetical protein